LRRDSCLDLEIKFELALALLLELLQTLFLLFLEGDIDLDLRGDLCFFLECLQDGFFLELETLIVLGFNLVL
jgi:hypothetical protein